MANYFEPEIECASREEIVALQNERLAKVKVQLDGFFGTELMTTLSKLHVEKVRSPIRKTNVILKNPNFRKAEELWNYIQTYVNKDNNVVDKKNYYDEGNLKDEYNLF